jgi:hypothetical protein
MRGRARHNRAHLRPPQFSGAHSPSKCEHHPRRRAGATGILPTMENKDTFMRYAVIGSVALVGLLAVLVRLHA